ncbi:MAG TPA: 50S ribosomal protein L29 [bacterium]|jgi:large subunit ribosomal protein L29|nr:50S ribosomal protein L29 [bacterium]
MDASELRELRPDELLRRLDDLQKELFKAGLRVAGTEPNSAKVRALRRDLAKLKTVLGEKGVRV